MSVLSLLALGCAGKQIQVERPGETIDTALDRLRRGLRRHVADPQRRERALARVDELREALVGFDRLAQQWRTDSHQAASEGAGPKQLIAIADRNNLELRCKLRDVAQIAVTMRDDVLADEWRVLFTAAKQAKS